MAINRRTTLFFDASVLVAGAHSASGGSALLLEACRPGGFTAQTTFLIVLEAYHTLDRDFPRRSMDRFRGYLNGIDWHVLPVPHEGALQRYAALIDAKDVHVLAAAAEGESEFLVTLDRRRILAAAEAVQAAGLRLRLMTPGDFTRQCYPLHEEYGSLPRARG